MRTTSLGQRRLVHLGQEAGGVVLELLEVHAVVGDLGQRLAVGRARHGDADRARGAVPGQPDDPHVVAEVLAAELGTDAELLHLGEDLGLELEVTEAVAQRGALGRQRVEVAGRGQLGGLDRELGRRAPDDDRQVVRRAGGGAEGPQLLVEEPRQALRVEQRLGLLEQVALVGRAAALGHEQQLVGVAVDGRDLDLRGQVRLGVDLVPHGERGQLAVAQVVALVGVEHAAGDGLLVAAAGEHELALLALDDGGAGVLAHGQHAARRDAGVLEEVEGDEAVVGRRLGILEDAAELTEVAGPEIVGDLVHGQCREPGEDLGFDREEAVTAGREAADAVGGHEPVGRLVGAQGQQLGVRELGHASRSWPSAGPLGPRSLLRRRSLTLPALGLRPGRSGPAHCSADVRSRRGTVGGPPRSGHVGSVRAEAMGSVRPSPRQSVPDPEPTPRPRSAGTHCLGDFRMRLPAIRA